MQKRTAARSFYGSNYLYRMHSYVQEVDNVAQYGVHFSDYPKWGILPKTRFFPSGVYFYALTQDCSIPGGYATNRRWANIAKLQNERLIILKEDSPLNFEGDAPALIQGLYDKYGNNINRPLHDLGYDGIVDYDGLLLFYESCQGVITWPTGAFYIVSFAADKPRSRYERLELAERRFSHIPAGTLQLTYDEVRKIMSMRPKFTHRWDRNAVYRTFVAGLLRTLDFNFNSELWPWWVDGRLEYLVEDDSYLYALADNPTVPREFWEGLAAGSPYKINREIAKDALEEYVHEHTDA